VEHDGAVVEAGPAADRGSHDDDRAQLGRCLCQVDDRGVDGIEEDVLEEQVVDGVAGERELWEEGDVDAVVMEGLHLLRDPRRVGCRVRHRHRHRARGDAGEAMGVEVAELAHRGHDAHPSFRQSSEENMRWP